MAKIIGISGSLRKNSFNTKLLRLAQKKSKDDIDVVTLEGIPLYNGDVEEQNGVPDSVINLQEKIKTSAGVIISTREYNNGISGVLKNTIDWLSRPKQIIEEIYFGNPFAMMGVTVGNFGTINAQTNFIPVLRFLRVNLWCGSAPYLISSAHNKFTENDELSNNKDLDRFKNFLDGFSNFVNSC